MVFPSPGFVGRTEYLSLVGYGMGRVWSWVCPSDPLTFFRGKTILCSHRQVMTTLLSQIKSHAILVASQLRSCLLSSRL